MEQHEGNWTKSKLIVVGKVYPSYSKAHDEVVCTGGIRPETGELLRLHPIPYRYLDGEHRFSSWQWIEARIRLDPRDTRPNTYRIDPQSIVLLDKVPQGLARREILEACNQRFGSVEDLQAQQEQDQSSLGVIRPRAITSVLVQQKSVADFEDWSKHEDAVLSQPRLFGEQPKKLDYIDSKFMLGWVCSDDACKGHEMALHQWDTHALYRRMRRDHGSQEAAAAMTRQKLEEMLDMDKRDLFFFLGNYHYRPKQFGLMDILSLKKASDSGQGRLF